MDVEILNTLIEIRDNISLYHQEQTDHLIDIRYSLIWIGSGIAILIGMKVISLFWEGWRSKK